MTPLRRLPAALWILAPLVVALLYAVAYPLLAPKPDRTTVVPEGAVLAHRFRDLATVDRTFWWYGRPDPERWSGRVGDRIGSLRNVPGLAGVDRAAPFHWVLLPREGRPDATMAIFALEDEDAFRSAFEDPRLLDLGHVRHAQHLEVRGRFAAVAWDAEAVRKIGTAGLTIEDRGEDHALVADVPGALRYALLVPTDLPWREILQGLGYGGERPTVAREGETPIGLSVHAGRALRVLGAWSTLRAWFFAKTGRISVELVPSADDAVGLRRAFAAVSPDAAWQPPGIPPRAKAWAWTPSGEARTALLRSLYFAGVDLPQALAAGESEPGARGGLFAWTEIASGAGHAWTIGLAAPSSPRAFVELSHWIPGWPGGEQGVDLPAGAPITVYDTAAPRPTPPGRALRRTVGDLEVAAIGPEAEIVAGSLEAVTTAFERPAPPAPGLRLVAAFFLDEPRAQKILGRELESHGLLAVLAGGSVEGSVWTDGERLRIELRRLGP